MKLRKSLIAFLLVITLSGTYYFAAYDLPDKEQQEFLSALSQPLAAGKTEFDLASVTPFDWDDVEIVVQVDDSWDEGSILKIIKRGGYAYNYLDVLYLPRLLKREYESAFIFIKEKEIVEVIRLDTREIMVKDTVYHFDSIVRSAEKNSFIVLAHNVRPQAQWMKEHFPTIDYQADLSFYKPREK